MVSKVSGKDIMEPQKFTLSVIERNLLTKISVAAQRTGYSYADTETLAFWCECTTRTIQRAISKLLKLELIAVHKISYRSRQKVRCFKITQLGKVSKNLYISKNKKLSTKVVQKLVHNSSSVATNVATNVAASREYKEYKEYNKKEKILKKKDSSFCEPVKSKEEILIIRFGFAKVQAAKEKLNAYEKRDGIKCFNAYLEKTIENADSDTRLDENYYANKTFVDQRYDFFVKNGFRMAYKSKNVLALDVNGYTETFNLRDSENAFRLNMRWFLEEKGGFVVRR